MRSKLIYTIALIFLAPIQSMALEPVNETHAMFYYKVPFSASKKPENKPTFGFRMDHTSYEQGGMIEYQQLMNRTAALDFRMGSDGVQGLYVSGVDYLQRFRLQRAAEDEAGDMEEGATETAEKKGPGTMEKVGTDIADTIDEIIHTVPLGFMMGGVIAIVLVSGVGG